MAPPATIGEFEAIDIIATLILIIVSTMAVTVGLGGGGLYIPILMILVGYSTHEATALSQSLMFGGTVGAFILNARSKHPLVKRPLLDIDLVLFMAPLTVSGANLGVIINRLVPSYIIAIVLVFVLSFSIRTTLKKTIQQFRKEKQIRRENREAKLAEKNISKTHTYTVDTYTETIIQPTHEPDPSTTTHEDTHTEQQSENLHTEEETHTDGIQQPTHTVIPTSNKHNRHYTAEYFYQLESRFQIKKIVVLVIFWLVSLAFSFVRGVTGELQVVETCSLAYWLVFALNLVIFIMCSFSFGKFYLLKQQNIKESVNYKFIDGDLHYTSRRLLIIGSQTLVAGTFAGLVGVGGGLILNPLLLSYNVLPQVATSVNALLILFSSSSAALSLLSSGHSPLDIAALLAVCCGISSFFGKYVIDDLVRRYQATSILLSLLLVIMILSTSSILGVSIYDLATGNTEAGGLELLCTNPI